MNPLRVPPVEIVRAGHHTIPVEALSAYHGWLTITRTLTLGDLIVGVGTLLLAAFTWKLARATYALDERNAARERVRDERRVRGVARLVLGELAVVRTSVETSSAKDHWHWFYPLPHNAWEREGVIAGGVIHGWIAQALRNRQFCRERPELFA